MGRSPFRLNVRFGPLQFLNEVPTWMLLVPTLGILSCCCCGGLVGLFG